MRILGRKGHPTRSCDQLLRDIASLRPSHRKETSFLPPLISRQGPSLVKMKGNLEGEMREPPREESNMEKVGK